MYLIELGPVIYERKGGGGWSLPEALIEVYGVGDARILRAEDLSVAVERAGSSAWLQHVSRHGNRRPVERRKSRQRLDAYPFGRAVR